MSVVGQYAPQFGPEPILGILLETIILIILLVRDAGAESSSFQFNHACSMKPLCITLPGLTEMLLHLRLGLMEELPQDNCLNLDVAPDQTVDEA